VRVVGGWGGSLVRNVYGDLKGTDGTKKTDKPKKIGGPKGESLIRVLGLPVWNQGGGIN